VSATLDWILRHGYLGMYGLLAGGVVALPVPEDTTLVVAGCLVARGRWALAPTWAAAAAVVSPESRSVICSVGFWDWWF